jgi:hypothetical protein
MSSSFLIVHLLFIACDLNVLGSFGAFAAYPVCHELLAVYDIAFADFDPRHVLPEKAYHFAAGHAEKVRVIAGASGGVGIMGAEMPHSVQPLNLVRYAGADE